MPWSFRDSETSQDSRCKIRMQSMSQQRRLTSLCWSSNAAAERSHFDMLFSSLCWYLELAQEAQLGQNQRAALFWAFKKEQLSVSKFFPNCPINITTIFRGFRAITHLGAAAAVRKVKIAYSACEKPTVDFISPICSSENMCSKISKYT